MHRILLFLAGFAPAALVCQESAGAELWRLAATTLPVPPALATGGTALFWNPAEPPSGDRARFALDVIETAPTVGAEGILFTARARVRRLGQLGLVYGRMAIGDLVRTSLSPDPDPGVIPYHTESVGANWSTALGATSVGATVAYRNTSLDLLRSSRWTLDVGARHTWWDALTVSAATHFFSHVSSDDPAQDVYGGIELRVWRGPLWGTQGVVRGRYGLTTAHGFAADHLLGAGFELGRQFAADIVGAREGSYGERGWRVVAGAGIAVGRYRLTLARDAAANDVGAAYRVGLELRIP